MKLFDLVSSPWAILPETYQQIRELYAAHVLGPKLDLESIERIAASAARRHGEDGLEASSGKRQRVDSYTYTQSGVGVIELFGPMMKRPSGISRACSETTGTAQAIQSLRTLASDPDVKAIILHIDSPGGTVDGTRDLAQEVAKVRGVKPIHALADGTMCSAAYWVGAAADRIHLANLTTRMGSIGVVATHVDVSGAEAKEGIKTTEITAGAYKRVVSPYKPLDDPGRAFLQETVDDIYTLFVNDVSTFRAVPVGTVLERMADGRVFMGDKALEAGLADGVSSLDDLIAELSRDTKAKRPGAGAASINHNPHAKEEPMTLTREALAAQEGGQDLINALLEEGKTTGIAEATAGHAEALKAAQQAGADAEHARWTGILGANLGYKGHEALLAGLAADRTTTREQAMEAVAEAQRQTDQLNARDRGTKHVPFGGEAEGGGASPEAALRDRWESSPTLRNLHGDFESFKKAEDALSAAEQNGRIKTKGGN